jgi:hypothetical protein
MKKLLMGVLAALVLGSTGFVTTASADVICTAGRVVGDGEYCSSYIRCVDQETTEMFQWEVDYFECDLKGTVRFY